MSGRSNARTGDNSAEHITLEHVRQSAGLAVSDSLFAVADAVLRRDVPAVLQEIDRMFENSIDFEKMCVQLIAHYRGLMMAKAVKNPQEFVSGLPQDAQRLSAQAAGLPHGADSLQPDGAAGRALAHGAHRPDPRGAGDGRHQAVQPRAGPLAGSHPRPAGPAGSAGEKRGRCPPGRGRNRLSFRVAGRANESSEGTSNPSFSETLSSTS